VVLARTFDNLAKNTQFSELKSEVAALDAKLFEKLNKQSQLLNSTTAAQNYLAPFLDRHKAELSKLVSEALDKKDFSGIGGLLLLHAIENNDILPKDKQVEFLQEIFKQNLSPKTATFKTHSLLSETILEKIKKIAAAKTQDRDNIQKDILNSSCFSCKAALIPMTIGDKALAFDYDQAVADNPILTKDFLVSLANQAVTQFPKLSEAQLESDSHDIFTFNRKSLMYFMGDPDFKKNGGAAKLGDLALAMVKERKALTKVRKLWAKIFCVVCML
jgi:F0F1-type ATP synthase delta subunit